MIQQAGILSVVLYEDKGLTYNYFDADTLCQLTNTGNTLTIINDYIPQVDVTPAKNNNASQSFEYGLRFRIWDYDDDAIDDLAMICESIYGWKMLVTFYDGTIKFLDVPLFIEKEGIDINKSMNFNVELTSRAATDKRFIEYDSTKSISEYEVH